MSVKPESSQATCQRVPVPILVDTDMGSDCDDVGALAVLHALAAAGLARPVGCIYSSGKNPYGIGCIAALHAYYGVKDVPLGASHDLDFGDPKDPFAGGIARDTGAYGHAVVRNTDATELVRAYRQMLVREANSSVTLVTIGHLKGIYELQESPADEISSLRGAELLAKKVSRWVCMGGDFPESTGRPGWNFAANDSHPYTTSAIAQFPGEIVFLGREAAEKIITGRACGTLPCAHPLRRAYEGFNTYRGVPLADGRASWDPCAVLYAVCGAAGLWQVIGPGRCHVCDDGSVSWREDPNGRHFYLKPDRPAEEMAAAVDHWIYFDPIAMSRQVQASPQAAGDKVASRKIFSCDTNSSAGVSTTNPSIMLSAAIRAPRRHG